MERKKPAKISGVRSAHGMPGRQHARRRGLDRTPPIWTDIRGSPVCDCVEIGSNEGDDNTGYPILCALAFLPSIPGSAQVTRRGIFPSCLH